MPWDSEAPVGTLGGTFTDFPFDSSPGSNLASPVPASRSHAGNQKAMTAALFGLDSPIHSCSAYMDVSKAYFGAVNSVFAGQSGAAKAAGQLQKQLIEVAKRQLLQHGLWLKLVLLIALIFDGNGLVILKV